MNKKIRTYEDLLEEQQRLMGILKGHEALMKQDMAGVRNGLKPVGKVMNMVNKFSTRDQTGPFANFGLEFGLDLLLRRFILARTGWFTKIAVPYLVKNYASHVITEEKRTVLVQKINAFFQKLRPKPAPAAYTASNTSAGGYTTYRPDAAT